MDGTNLWYQTVWTAQAYCAQTETNMLALTDGSLEQIRLSKHSVDLRRAGLPASPVLAGILRLRYGPRIFTSPSCALAGAIPPRYESTAEERPHTWRTDGSNVGHNSMAEHSPSVVWSYLALALLASDFQ